MLYSETNMLYTKFTSIEEKKDFFIVEDSLMAFNSLLVPT